jgi:HD domain
MSPRRKPQPLVSRAVIGLAAAAVALSLVWSLDDLAALGDAQLLPVFVFMGAIAMGEIVRVAGFWRRRTAPLSTAAALGFAMTSLATVGDSGHLPSSAIVVATALAMAAGAAVRSLSSRSIDAVQMSARLVGVSVTAFLYRRADFGGSTILDWQEGVTHDRWLVALVMLCVCSAGMLVTMSVLGIWRARINHTPLGRGVRDEISESLVLTSALVTSSALIALAEGAVGILAVPLFLLPLMLTLFAVRRYIAVRQTYRQTIEALSRLTELSGHTRSHHASRVARLALGIGRELGMPQREVEELERAALLHDLGQVALREPIPGGATVLAAPADQIRMAHDGAEIVRQTGVLDGVAALLEAQTTPYRQVREFGEPLPMASRIIKVANAFDDLTAGSRNHVQVDAAMERIHLGLGYEYDPTVVDALTRVLARRRQIGAHAGGGGTG